MDNYFCNNQGITLVFTKFFPLKAYSITLPPHQDWVVNPRSFRSLREDIIHIGKYLPHRPERPKTKQSCMWSCPHWSQNTAKLYVCEVVNIEPKHIYVVCEVVNSEAKTQQSCMWSCQHWTKTHLRCMWSCQQWSQNTSKLYVKLQTLKPKHINVVCEVANIEAKTHQCCMWSCQQWSQNTSKLYVKLPTLKPKHINVVCEVANIEAKT